MDRLYSQQDQRSKHRSVPSWPESAPSLNFRICKVGDMIPPLGVLWVPQVMDGCAQHSACHEVQVTGTVLDWLLGTGHRAWHHSGLGRTLKCHHVHGWAKARVDPLGPPLHLSPSVPPVSMAPSGTVRKLRPQPRSHLVVGLKGHPLS